MVGRELVSWILRTRIVQDRDDAQIFGQLLMDMGFVYHVNQKNNNLIL